MLSRIQSNLWANLRKRVTDIEPPKMCVTVMIIGMKGKEDKEMKTIIKMYSQMPEPTESSEQQQ